MRVVIILLLTFIVVIAVAGSAGLALSVALHFIDFGTFGFSWSLPLIFAAAAAIGYFVYFVQFWLGLRGKGR